MSGSAVSFRGVWRTFRIGRPWGIKDAVIGSRGMRYKSKVVDALRDVSFEIAPGESVALLGHNGAGKSTALKLLAGTIQPSRGVVATNGRVAPLLELGAGFHPDLTGRENLHLNGAILGVRKAYLRLHEEEIVDFAGVQEFIDSPIRFYSSGMVVRLAFSIATHVEPEIVLIDEVLSVGDAAFQEKCLTRMSQLRDEGRTMVLVTHSLPQAQAFCHRALILENGRLIFDGDVQAAATTFGRSLGLD